MRLADYLTANGLTAARFADLIGVNRSTVARWLDPERPIMPHQEHRARILEVTGGQVTANDFVPETSAASGPTSGRPAAA